MKALLVILLLCLCHQVLLRRSPRRHRGQCPRFPRLPCPYEYKNECRRDSDCREDHKCCWTLCGFGCVTPRGDTSSPLAFCSLPSDYGSCDNRGENRWYYNPSVKRCERFLYLGCGGNENNFRSEEYCARRCDKSNHKCCWTLCGFGCVTPRGDTSSPLAFCSLPSDYGSCDNRGENRWYYNPSVKRCERFLYLGCGGNENNFRSEEYCARRCDKSTPECLQPVVEGDCDGVFFGYVYNTKTGRCENYAGCPGSDNFFETLSECKRKCRGFRYWRQK